MKIRQMKMMMNNYEEENREFPQRISKEQWKTEITLLRQECLETIAKNRVAGVSDEKHLKLLIRAEICDVLLKMFDNDN